MYTVNEPEYYSPLQITPDDQKNLAASLLKILRRHTEKTDAIKDILKAIKDLTGIEAVGIRLQDKEDFPYYTTSGFPDEFVEKERTLCARNAGGEIIRDSTGNPVLECMCGNVLCSRTDPSLPFFTKGGSFWSNCTTCLLANTTEKDRQARTRNRCNGEGYESVALIPLHDNERTIGLLQLNDRRKNCFTIELITFFENLGEAIGVALKKLNFTSALNDTKYTFNKRIKELEIYRSLFETMNEGFCLHEIVNDNSGSPIDYIILAANPSFEKIIGIKAKDVIGKRATTAYNVAEAPYIDLYAKVALSGQPTRFETHFAPMDKYFSIAVFSPSRGLFATIFEDITKARHDQEELQQSRERFRSIMQNTHAGYFYLNKDGIVKDVNPAWAKLYGYNSPDEVINHHFTEIQRQESVESVNRIFEGILKGDTRYHHGEISRKCRDGSTGHHFYAAHPVIVNGEATGVEGFIVDSTAQRAAEEALRRSEEKFRSLFNNAGVGIFRTKIDGSAILDFNEKSLEFFGGIREEIINKPSTMLWAELEERQELVRRLQKQGFVTDYECRLINKKSELRYCLLSVRSYPDQDILEGAIIDITDRKLAEQALINSESQLNHLFNNSPVAIGFSHKGNYVNVNSMLLKMFGYEKNELIGKPIMTVISPECHDQLMILIRRRENGESGHLHFEIKGLRKNGEVFDLEVESSVCMIDGKEFSIAHHHDITERRKTQTALQNTQKLESLGLLAGGIAHDFNNLLGGIYGYIDMAEGIAAEPKLRTYLSKALSTIDRGRDLTRQLITFAKGGAPVLTQDNLFPFVKETALFALSGSTVACTFEAPENLWESNFDKNQIGQVIDNIVINAKQAMPDGGIMEISAQNIELSKNQFPLLKPGKYIKISIKDHGTGIPGKILPQIFDPFFTTKSTGHGLGLATSFSIIKRHEGTIEVESKPGKGSTFHIILPAAEGRMPQPKPNSSDIFTGSGLFIIMDDQEVVRDVSCNMIESLGFKPVCVRNGQEAVDFIVKEIKSGGTISGALFDLTVPGEMGGKEAVDMIHRLGIEIPVFAASGHAEDPIIANPRKFGFIGSITKPFRKAEIVDMFKKHLKQPD